LALLSVIYLAGCRKEQPISSPEAPQVAVARARAVRDGLTPSMSDEQILRKLGYDPADFRAYRNQGVDGYSMDYTNDATYIIICRSLVSGTSILRLHPKGQQQHWIVERNEAQPKH